MSRRDNEERTGMKFISVLLSVLILIILAGYLIFKHYYNMLGTASGKKTESGLSISIPEEMPDIDELADNLEKPESNGGDEDNDFLRTGYNAPLFDQTGIYNVMLVGVDTRENEFAGRSDAMILISFSKETGRIVMTSFLRDIYVDIPDNGHNRLNAAHVFGGTDLLKETILKNFGIEIDNTIVVNFYLVKDFVDAVGGIDAELTADEITHINSYVTTQAIDMGSDPDKDKLPAQDGTYHLNGNQALAYSRVRYVGTDFARTGRQRNVLAMCMDSVKSMSLKELNDLAVEFLPRIKTDMNEADCLGFFLQLFAARGYDTTSFMIPDEGTYSFETIDSMAVITVDFEENTKRWYNTVSDK